MPHIEFDDREPADGIKEPLRQFRLHQAFAQMREVGLLESRVFQTHVQIPAKPDAVVEDLAARWVRADRVQCGERLALTPITA